MRLARYQHPIDWDQVEENRLEGLETAGVYEDWREYIRTVDRRTVPLPAELTETMERLDNRLPGPARLHRRTG
ncbi:hypothetical protein [Streptomyces sp. NPDC048639]|uniref:hypothetical protein n=1 Tax=Streptomyces sp. NPDC048639 TaxID=3365581 RepID=UPI00371DB373